MFIALEKWNIFVSDFVESNLGNFQFQGRFDESKKEIWAEVWNSQL